MGYPRIVDDDLLALGVKADLSAIGLIFLLSRSAYINIFNAKLGYRLICKIKNCWLIVPTVYPDYARIGAKLLCAAQKITP